jgi:hypothetical protein
MNPETGEEWVRGCMATDLSDSWLNYRPDTPDSDWQRRTKEDICYNEAATLDDGSCDYVKGCTNKDATNYDKDANKDDDSCEVPEAPPPPPPSPPPSGGDEPAPPSPPEEEEDECPDSPSWTGDQYIWFFAWVIKVLLLAVAGLFVYKRGWTQQVSFHAAETEGQDELEDKISKTETFKSGSDDSFTTDIWEATLFSSRFQGVNICLADPYNDEAREVVCVVDSAVSTRDIGRFILMADTAKMDRSSKDSRDLKFLGGNRRLRRSAGAKKKGFGSLIGADTDTKGTRMFLKKIFSLILLALGCWVAYQFLVTAHDHATGLFASSGDGGDGEVQSNGCSRGDTTCLNACAEQCVLVCSHGDTTCLNACAEQCSGGR